MSDPPDPVVNRLARLGAPLRRSGVILSGEAAAHAHLAATTSSVPGEPARYLALPPWSWEVLEPSGVDLGSLAHDHGLVRDSSAVGDVVRGAWGAHTAVVALADGTLVPVVSRDVTLAMLLARGGLAIGLAGMVVRICRTPPVDPDDIRDLLKAARQGERFQPLLELLAVA